MLEIKAPGVNSSVSKYKCLNSNSSSTTFPVSSEKSNAHPPPVCIKFYIQPALCDFPLCSPSGFPTLPQVITAQSLITGLKLEVACDYVSLGLACTFKALRCLAFNFELKFACK